MKKRFVFLAVLLVLLGLCAAASAQVFTFEEIHAKIDLPESAILLTPDNLGDHTQWAASQGSDAETLAAKWREEGVLAVADDPEGVYRVVVTAVQDEDAKTYFDLSQQTEKTRKAYGSKHLKDGFKDQGYTYQTAVWKKKDQYGSMLHLKYKRTLGSETYRGYQRRCIRNGYTITVDYQVHGRGLRGADEKALTKIMDSFVFTEVEMKPAEATPRAVFTSVPPEETNTGKFTVEGTCETNLSVIGVVMKMSSPDPIVYETTPNKQGKFSIKVTLPEEGVWLMTLQVLSGAIVTQEEVFNVTTYRSTLLPVNFDSEVPDTFAGDQLVIAGKTDGGVTVQCITKAPGAADETLKQIRTNNSGRFSFKIPTAAEGDYSVTLAFSKKGLSERRYSYTVTRKISDAELHRKAKSEAIKPAYNVLMNKLKGFTGSIMRYTMYVVDIEEKSDGWYVTMAMKKTKTNDYTNLVMVVADEAPSFTIDSEQVMYGTCTGPYVLMNADGSEDTMPCFKLLFWESKT